MEARICNCSFLTQFYVCFDMYEWTWNIWVLATSDWFHLIIIFLKVSALRKRKWKVKLLVVLDFPNFHKVSIINLMIITVSYLWIYIFYFIFLVSSCIHIYFAQVIIHGGRWLVKNIFWLFYPTHAVVGRHIFLCGDNTAHCVHWWHSKQQWTNHVRIWRFVYTAIMFVWICDA